MTVISSDEEFDSLEVFGYDYSFNYSSERAAPLKCCGRGMKRPPLSDIWISEHLLQCEPPNQTDYSYHRTLFDPLKHKFGFSIIRTESSIQDESDSEIFFSDVEDNFKSQLSTLTDDHLYDVPPILNCIGEKNNLHASNPVESSSCGSEKLCNETNYNIRDIDKQNEEFDEKLVYADVTYSNDTESKEENQLYYKIINDQSDEKSKEEKQVDEVNLKEIMNKKCGTNILTSSTLVENYPISIKNQGSLKNSLSEDLQCKPNTPTNVTDENVNIKTAAPSLSSNDSINSEGYYDLNLVDGFGCAHDNIKESNVYTLNEDRLTSKSQLHPDLKVFSAQEKCAYINNSNNYFKSKSSDMAQVEARKKHFKFKYSRSSQKAFNKNNSSNNYQLNRIADQTTLNNDSNSESQLFSNLSHKTNTNLSELQEKNSHLMARVMDQNKKVQKYDCLPSEWVKSMNFTSPSKFEKSDFTHNFSLSQNSKSFGVRDKEPCSDVNPNQLSERENDDLASSIKPDFFYDHFTNFEHSLREKSKVFQSRSEFPELSSFKATNEVLAAGSVWAVKPNLKSIANSLIKPGTTTTKESCKVQLKYESRGKNEVTGVKTLVIKNIPQEVGYEDVKNVLLGYGDVSNLSLVSYKQKNTAQVQMDCDLDWVISCLNDTHPFGTCSESLECYLI